MEEHELLSSYHVDTGDPDLLILRRNDDSIVAVFSARGATRKEICKMAWKDAAEQLVGTSLERSLQRDERERRFDA